MITLLYVDDEPELLDLGKIFLERSGQFSVKTTSSTYQALEMLHSGQYDAIISDYQMPEMDGIEFLKRVRGSGNTIPFIIFTGRGREEIVIQALNEGADFYLQKGGEPLPQFAELAHKIRQAVHQRRTEASNRDYERREADIINFLPDATFAIDTNGMVIAWNRAMEMMTGVSAAQILGKGNFSYSLPFYGKLRPILIDQILRFDDSVALLYDSIRREGSKLFSEVFIPSMNGRHDLFLWFTASPLYNRDGIVIGAIESIRDITDRKCAESALRESEQRYRNVVEDQTEFICRFLPDGTHVFVNDAYCRYFRKKREEIIGHHFQPKLPREDQKKVRALITSLTPDNPVGFVRQRVIFPDTSVRWQHWVDRAIFDENGTLQEYQSVGRDITDVMNAELALEESERRYRNVVEDQTEFICRFRPDGTHVFVNDAYCRYFGLERKEIVGHRFRPEIPAEDQELVKRFFVSLTPDHPVDTIDHRIIMPDGRICWQRWSDRAIFDSSGTLTEIQSVGRDVTDTKKAEEGLQSAHEQLMAIEEELRAHYQELEQSEERLRESEKTFRRILENMQDAYLRTDRDGNLVMVNPSAVRLYGYSSVDDMIGIPVQSLYRSPGSRQEMFGKLKERGTIGDFVGEARRKDGSLFWVSLNVQFITDDRGTVQGTEAIIRDITGRKRMEHSVQEANRKLSLLSGITRHDVVNQLTILQGYRKIAAMKEDDPVVADFLAKIDATAQTIARQIEFMKTYEELGVAAPAWFRLDEIIAEAGKPEVMVPDSCRNAEIFADPMLERVFFNLFDNATRHGKRVTKIVVSCEQVSDRLLIIVEDNGIGIPLDEKEKIFEKGFGKNTGFGLFLVREILAITGITVTETGEPGTGARFEIVIPKDMYRFLS
jgi:PAS domain S-box-containing protein